MVSRDGGRMGEKREKRTKKRKEGNQHAATGEAHKQPLSKLVVQSKGAA